MGTNKKALRIETIVRMNNLVAASALINPRDLSKAVKPYPITPAIRNVMIKNPIEVSKYLVWVVFLISRAIHQIKQ